jgi:hypothetical protein
MNKPKTRLTNTTVILGPPGSGKSAFSKASPAWKGIPVVDTEYLHGMRRIYSMLCTAYGPKWYLTSEIAAQKDELVDDLIGRLTDELSGKMLITSETQIAMMVHPDLVALAMPTPDVNFNNLIERNRLDEDACILTPQELSVVREYYLESAIEQQWVVIHASQAELFPASAAYLDAQYRRQRTLGILMTNRATNDIVKPHTTTL